MKKSTKKTKLEKEIEKQIRITSESMADWFKDFFDETKHAKYKQDAAKETRLIKRFLKTRKKK